MLGEKLLVSDFLLIDNQGENHQIKTIVDLIKRQGPKVTECEPLTQQHR